MTTEPNNDQKARLVELLQGELRTMARPGSPIVQAVAERDDEDAEALSEWFTAELDRWTYWAANLRRMGRREARLAREQETGS